MYRVAFEERRSDEIACRSLFAAYRTVRRTFPERSVVVLASDDCATLTLGCVDTSAAGRCVLARIYRVGYGAPKGPSLARGKIRSQH